MVSYYCKPSAAHYYMEQQIINHTNNDSQHFVSPELNAYFIAAVQQNVFGTKRVKVCKDKERFCKFTVNPAPLSEPTTVSFINNTPKCDITPVGEFKWKLISKLNTESQVILDAELIKPNCVQIKNPNLILRKNEDGSVRIIKGNIVVAELVTNLARDEFKLRYSSQYFDSIHPSKRYYMFALFIFVTTQFFNRNSAGDSPPKRLLSVRTVLSSVFCEICMFGCFICF